MWDIPRSGVEPTKSPVLAGRFFTTEPPGKPDEWFFEMINIYIYTLFLKLESNGEIRFYFLGLPKSLQMVTAATKLKDTCSLEEKL